MQTIGAKHFKCRCQAYQAVTTLAPYLLLRSQRRYHLRRWRLAMFTVERTKPPARRWSPIRRDRGLRLTNFATSNGPDVHVYLVAASDASDSATVKNAGFVDLGSIKGNVRDQNYDLFSLADLGKYQAVTICCACFGVNLGTAPLTVQN
jgi:electron transfer DM13